MAANLKDMTLTPTGAIKGNEMISDLEDTALDQERILPSSCFASSTVSLSGCLATEIKMRISSVHLWKSSSSCYVPISRYPILSSVRPVHAQPETDEEITEYYSQTTERPKASPPSRLPLPVVTCTDLTLWISLCQIQSARSSVEGHSRHPDCLASSVLMRAHPVDERWGQ